MLFLNPQKTDMTNKEKRAIDFAQDKHKELNLSDQHIYDKMKVVRDTIEDYKTGYEAAEMDNDEMMCRFAEWVNTKWHQWEQDGCHKYTSLYEGDDNEYTTKELLELFKQSLKQ